MTDSPEVRLEVLVSRADIAVTLGQAAKGLLSEVRQLPLSDDVRAGAVFGQLCELEQTLTLDPS